MLPNKYAEPPPPARILLRMNGICTLIYERDITNNDRHCLLKHMETDHIE